MSVRTKLTVAALRQFLKQHSRDTEITFGASRFRKKPLIFYRFKSRGDDVLQIELNELDENCDPRSEFDCRETVGDFLDRLELFPSEVNIDFGSSLDAIPLEFRELATVVAFNLEQTQEPNAEWTT